MKSQLIRFNQIYKEMDIIYHNYAKSLGLSDTAFWIFYCMSEHDCSFTQRELCRDWSFAPQTLNSSLKDMEKKGFIKLEPVPKNKRNKLILLTPEGERMVKEGILPLMKAECDSFSVLSDGECELMLSFTEKYTNTLKESIEGMIK